MEHAINVAAGHFSQAVGPTSRLGGSNDVDDNDNDDNSDTSDALGKALALIVQVCQATRTSPCKHC
jgi:hypothetical protein